MIFVKDISSEKEERDGIVYIDVFDCGHFRLTGLPWKETKRNYHRLDDRMADILPTGLKRRTNSTSGAQVSFKTDSSVISVHIVRNSPEFMEHMCDNSTCGLDIYVGEGSNKKFWHVCCCYNRENESVSTFAADGKMTEYTVNLPLYSGIDKLEIGLSPDARIDAPSPFAAERPVLVYGSSITQGGCCSRPGNLYTNIISRMLNVETICMGFSGSALGEECMAESFATLDLSAFVMDYDWNAPDAEHLEKTHWNFYRILRKAHPEMPIIIVSKCDYDDDPVSGEARRLVIKKTYDDAVASGDKNVYFVDGKEIFGNDFFRDSCTVDRIHPTDIGHMRLAIAVGGAVKQALEL